LAKQANVCPAFPCGPETTVCRGASMAERPVIMAKKARRISSGRGPGLNHSAPHNPRRSLGSPRSYRDHENAGALGAN
jgi:hypothetical protein